MVKLALKNNHWVTLSEWEAEKQDWTPTLEALIYHKNRLVESYGEKIQLVLLCGGDLVETFAMPGVWKEEHVIFLIVT